MSRRFRAPTAHGEVLADPPFDALPALVEANRKLLDCTDVTIGGLPLRDLRKLARREALVLASAFTSPLEGEVAGASPAGGGGGAKRDGSAFLHTQALPPHPPPAKPGGDLPLKGGGEDNSAPLLLTGHQPELSHPGVWVKNFALNGLARRLGGVPLHLIVDNDTLKSTTIRAPVFREGDSASVRLESVAFDTFEGEVPYEDRRIQDGVTFGHFAWRLSRSMENWGREPLFWHGWPHVLSPHADTTIGDRFASLRRRHERAWGCDNLELPVSRLSQTETFARFAQHILSDLPRFRDVYNAAIRAYRAANGIRSANHPAPELAEGEAPFWERTGVGTRRRATANSDVRSLRPRALTLTLFARVCLGDFFIHGIGGGKYDEVTDAIIRDYFGIEPPAYQVLSATLHLPLPGFPSTAADLTRAERRVRDLRWNPHVALPPGALTEALGALAMNEPPRGDHAARREWFRALQAIKEQMRGQVAGEVPAAEAELARVRSEVAANAILRRRDYPWVLYPEAMLREFFGTFL